MYDRIADISQSCYWLSSTMTPDSLCAVRIFDTLCTVIYTNSGPLIQFTFNIL